MKLTNVVFIQAGVRVGKRMVQGAAAATATPYGVLVPHADGMGLVGWHLVRWADVDAEATLADVPTKRARKVAAPVEGGQ